MADEHPLERLLRDAREKDETKSAAVAAEQRRAHDLQDQVRLQWARTKAGLVEEIGRANSVLEKHSLPERYMFRELPESGAGNIARCQLTLAYPAKSPRAEYDLSVAAADGRMILFHRATGQRHQKLTVFSASTREWEASLISLYEDHLKKGRDPSGPAADATMVTAVTARESP
jgi:hypothetical protein